MDVFVSSKKGNGTRFPKTTYANIVVTIEAMMGLVGIAVLTGLAFARFSRPTARVIFSRVAVIISIISRFRDGDAANSCNLIFDFFY